jgi:hypothetical protein
VVQLGKLKQPLEGSTTNCPQIKKLIASMLEILFLNQKLRLTCILLAVQKLGWLAREAELLL